jgi:hypothetical protein
MDTDLPPGRWFLKDDSRDLWQFFKMNEESWGWHETVFHRHGEPYPGARLYSIENHMVLDRRI